MTKNGKPVIKPIRNGPFLVENLRKLVNSSGKELETAPIMSLCRCGHSKNKPFCDGQHWRVRFKDHKN